MREGKAPWFYTDPNRRRSGSAVFGDLLSMVNHRHECGKPGMYLVTIVWQGQFIQANAVMDDYGDLRTVRD